MFDQSLCDHYWDSHPDNPANDGYEPESGDQADYWYDLKKDEGGEE